MSDERSTANNRMVLLLVAGLPVVMILAATWLWYFVVRGDLDLVGALGTANRGALVQPPRPIDEVTLHEPDGKAFRYAGLEPKWTMLIPAAGGHCDSICEHNLYVTRQIHTALGKEFNRVRRLYVSDTTPEETRLTVPELSDQHPVPAKFADFLVQEHNEVLPVVIGSDAMDTLFPELGREPDTWYLVDPAGWVMMSYDSAISYRDVMADLKFLLKNSRE